MANCWEDGIRNARIDSTMLGIEDHGCLTFSIGLDYGGVHQGFGGCAMDHCALRDVEGSERRPSILAGACIKGILTTVGVERWEHLKGAHVRAVVEDGLVRGIGHILKDRWFRIDSIFDHLQSIVETEAKYPDIPYTKADHKALIGVKKA